MILSSASPAVDHLQTADDPAADDDLVPRNRPFAEDTDIQRIAIASFGRRREAAHALVTVGARDKPVQRRVLRGGALRSIDAKIPGYLVNFILHEVERRDLDVRVENLRRIRTNLQTMPRVRSEVIDRAGSFTGRLRGNSLLSSRRHLEKHRSRKFVGLTLRFSGTASRSHCVASAASACQAAPRPRTTRE